MQQYPYNNQYVYSPQAEEANRRFRARLGQKREIKKIGSAVGVCILGYIVLENIITLPVLFGQFNALYQTNGVFQAALNIILSVFGLLLPFAIGGIYLRNRTGVGPFVFAKPKGGVTVVYIICFGMFVALAANNVTTLMMMVAEKLGYKMTAPDFLMPSSVTGRIVYAVSISVVPALTEEVAVRGAVMQPLRKYGNVFAIVVSSFVFAVLHGNFVQAPFALLVGFGLGYITCITESLWPAIAVHAANNLYSVAVQIFTEDFSEETSLKLYYILTIALLTVSIVGSVFFFLAQGRNAKLAKSRTLLTTREKTGAFVLNFPMIISIAILLFFSSRFVTKV